MAKLSPMVENQNRKLLWRILFEHSRMSIAVLYARTLYLRKNLKAKIFLNMPVITEGFMKMPVNSNNTHTVLKTYPIMKRDMMLAETRPETANSSLNGTNNKNSGKARTKNNSSKNKDIMVMAVLSPNFKPSLWMKSISNAEPPAAEGVTADVNSYSILTLNSDGKRSCLSDSKYSLHMLHKSLKQANKNARKRNNTVWMSK